jgi:hypothetical protein
LLRFSRDSRTLLFRPLLYSVPTLMVVACGLSVQGAAEDATSGDAGPNTPPTGGIDGSSSSETDAPVGVITDDSGNGSPDARSDSGALSGSCTLVFEDSFTNQNPNWDRLGTAQFQSGHVSLTQKNAGTQAGAIWWRQQLNFTGFLRVAIDIAVDAVGVMAADGIGIGWVSSAYTLGATGQNFGLCSSNMNGFAVAADTLDAKLLLIASINNSCGTNNGVFPANAVGASSILAEIRADSLTGKLDTSASHSRILTIPKTGFLGIAASTGNGTAEHSITAIRVTSCL